MIVGDVGEGEMVADELRYRCGPREVLYRNSPPESRPRHSPPFMKTIILHER